MSKIFSLASYEEEANKKYGTFQIDVGNKVVVHLRNPLRISEEKQARVFELVDELSALEAEKPEPVEGQWNEVGGDDENKKSMEELAKMRPLVIEFLTLVGDKNVDKLIERVKDDFAILMGIFEDYFREVGLGEASSSDES